MIAVRVDEQKLKLENLKEEVEVLRLYFQANFTFETNDFRTVAVRHGSFSCHFSEFQKKFRVLVVLTSDSGRLTRYSYVPRDIAAGDLAAQFGEIAEQLIHDCHEEFWGLPS